MWVFFSSLETTDFNLTRTFIAPNLHRLTDYKMKFLLSWQRFNKKSSKKVVISNLAVTNMLLFQLLCLIFAILLINICRIQCICIYT